MNFSSRCFHPFTAHTESSFQLSALPCCSIFFPPCFCSNLYFLELRCTPWRLTCGQSARSLFGSHIFSFCDNVHSEVSFYIKQCKYLSFSLQVVAPHLSSKSPLSLGDLHGDQMKCWHLSQLGEFVRDPPSLHFTLESRLDRQKGNIPDYTCLWCASLRSSLHSYYIRF